MMKVAHLFSSFRGLGGVESVLKYHHSHDAQWGIVSNFIIYFEAEIEPLERVHFLGFNSRTTIREARQRLATAIAQARPEVAVYHGTWGMPFLADLDQSQRRILVLHGETPGVEDQLRVRRQWLDGILCVSDPLRDLVRRCAPQLEEDRIEVLSYPIAPAGTRKRRERLAHRPLVLGFCGRLAFEQKRVDRLPPLCRLLDESGLNYRLEFLGDGPQRGWLESQFPDRSRFYFHGRKSGNDYWGVLGEWDVMLLTSDYEGTPIVLLEALSVGVIPLCPRINCGGDAYAKQIQVDLLYEPDDFAHVSATLNRLPDLSEMEMQRLRARCEHAVAAHRGNNYIRTFAGFLARLRAAPKASRDTFPWRPFPIDHCPFTILAKIGAVRRKALRLLRST